MGRREFLGLSGVVVAGAIAGCNSAGPRTAALRKASTPSPTSPRYWTPPSTRGPSAVVDVCIYGATSAGVAAAIQASRMGHRVTLLAFEDHVGGMTAAGLSATDTGDRKTIGGFARQFYQRVGSAYGIPVAYDFEPHIASEAFHVLLAAGEVTVRPLSHAQGFDSAGRRLVRLHLDDGATIDAKVFIDASYEGDLLALAGVPSTFGRESTSTYNEPLAGVTATGSAQQFRRPVDPFVRLSQPSSGVLPGVSMIPVAQPGGADPRLPAYTFRLCLSDRERNRLPLEQPAGYRAQDYELLRRYIAAGVWDALAFRVPVGNSKYDLNSTNAVSTDAVGASDGWVTATYAERNRIFDAHRRYVQGLLWFVTTDRRLPSRIRQEASGLGLARDEFAATGGWPPLLYIREARRMVSDYVMTQADCEGARQVPDPVALASFKIDVHSCQRVVVSGTAANEGSVTSRVTSPYGVSYRSIVPSRAHCDNLIVPVCLSASHVAFSSIRMEPVFMMLGQAAGVIAGLSLDRGVAVQDLDYPLLQRTLVAEGAIL